MNNFWLNNLVYSIMNIPIEIGLVCRFSGPQIKIDLLFFFFYLHLFLYNFRPAMEVCVLCLSSNCVMWMISELNRIFFVHLLFYTTFNTIIASSDSVSTAQSKICYIKLSQNSDYKMPFLFNDLCQTYSIWSHCKAMFPLEY